MRKAPMRSPNTEGEKSAVTTQLWPGGSCAPHVWRISKSDLPSTRYNWVMVTGPVPLFVIPNCFTGLVSPNAQGPRIQPESVRPTSSITAAELPITCAVPVTPSAEVNIRVALAGPATLGRRETVIEQEAHAARAA